MRISEKKAQEKAGQRHDCAGIDGLMRFAGISLLANCVLIDAPWDEAELGSALIVVDTSMALDGSSPDFGVRSRLQEI
jgi:hypothetical protein